MRSAQSHVVMEIKSALTQVQELDWLENVSKDTQVPQHLGSIRASETPASFHQVCSAQRSGATGASTQWPHAQLLVEPSSAGGDGFSASPSVGTLLYRQPGAASASALLPGDSPGPGAHCDGFRSSRRKDTMRKTAADATTTAQT